MCLARGRRRGQVCRGSRSGTLNAGRKFCDVRAGGCWVGAFAKEGDMSLRRRTRRIVYFCTARLAGQMTRLKHTGFLSYYQITKLPSLSYSWNFPMTSSPCIAHPTPFGKHIRACAKSVRIVLVVDCQEPRLHQFLTRPSYTPARPQRR